MMGLINYIAQPYPSGYGGNDRSYLYSQPYPSGYGGNDRSYLYSQPYPSGYGSNDKSMEIEYNITSQNNKITSKYGSK